MRGNNSRGEALAMKCNIPKLTFGYIVHNLSDVVKEYSIATSTSLRNSQMLLDKCKSELCTKERGKPMAFFKRLSPLAVRLLNPILKKIYDNPLQCFKRMQLTNEPNDETKINNIRSVLTTIIKAMGQNYNIYAKDPEPLHNVKFKVDDTSKELVIENVLDLTIITYPDGSYKIEITKLE